MSVGERLIDYGVSKSADFIEGAIIKSAEVAVVAGVLGIGTTAAGLALMAADHTREIVQASKWMAGKLVR